MMAAGGFIEPFWEMYAFHKHDNIFRLLNKYKVGVLHPDDVLKPDQIPDFSDVKKEEIERSINLKVLTQSPFNAHTSPNVLRSPFTPPKDYYVSNHNLVPTDIDESDYQLEIFEGKDDLKKELTLDDLKKMKQHEVMFALSCTGNRRKQLLAKFP